MKPVQTSIKKLAEKQPTNGHLVVTHFPRTGEPTPINNYLGEVEKIIRHPDRNRLMALLFKDYC